MATQTLQPKEQKHSNSAFKTAEVFFQKHWLTLLLGAFVGYTIVRFGILVVRPPGFVPNDFLTFFKASDRLFSNQLFYNHDDDSPYKYSPTFLLIFSKTYYLLSKTTAWFVWCTFSIGIFTALMHLLWKVAIPKKLPTNLFLLWIGAFSVFSWHGYIEHFSYGQGDYFIFSLFLAAALFERSSRPLLRLLSIFAMSGILVMKPQAGIFLAYFFITRSWKFLVLTAITTVAFLLFPLVYWDFSRLLLLFSQWKHCLSQQHPAFMTGSLNQNIAAVLSRVLGHREWVFYGISILLVIGATMVLVLTAMWASARNASQVVRTRLMISTLMFYTVMSPLSWRWATFVWMPVGVILAFDAWDLKKRPAGVSRLLFIFSVLGIFIQKFVAESLGVREVDHLSFYGLYCLGNWLLFLESLLALKLRSQERALDSPDSKTRRPAE